METRLLAVNLSSNHFINSAGQCQNCPTNANCDGKYYGCHYGFSNNFYGDNCACSSNRYIKNPTACETCPQYATCDGSNTFTCNPGFVKSGDNCVCSSNQFINTGNQCQSCPVTAVCDGSSNWTCRIGYVKSGNQCVTCPFDQYIKDEKCIPCAWI